MEPTEAASKKKVKTSKIKGMMIYGETVNKICSSQETNTERLALYTERRGEAAGLPVCLEIQREARFRCLATLRSLSKPTPRHSLHKRERENISSVWQSLQPPLPIYRERTEIYPFSILSSNWHSVNLCHMQRLCGNKVMYTGLGWGIILWHQSNLFFVLLVMLWNAD